MLGLGVVAKAMVTKGMRLGIHSTLLVGALAVDGVQPANGVILNNS